ncbi:unnamed protein product, partial [Nesidiocoris tenuis]
MANPSTGGTMIDDSTNTSPYSQPKFPNHRESMITAMNVGSSDFILIEDLGPKRKISVKEKAEQVVPWFEKTIKRLWTPRTITKRLPITKWAPRYGTEDAVGDLVAGITVGLTVIPQSLAYSNIAGLPSQAVHGLGPAHAILLAFLSGVIMFIMGVVGLGIAIDFISDPVSSGFTSAVALLILSSQVKDILGIRASGATFIEMWRSIAEDVQNTKFWDTLVGLICVVILILMRSRAGVEYLLLTPDRCLIFPSVDYVSTLVMKQSVRRGIPVVIDCSHIYGADFTAAKVIEVLCNDFSRRQQPLFFYNLKTSVVAVFEGVQPKDFIVYYNEDELDNLLLLHAVNKHRMNSLAGNGMYRLSVDGRVNMDVNVGHRLSVDGVGAGAPRLSVDSIPRLSIDGVPAISVDNIH